MSQPAWTPTDPLVHGLQQFQVASPARISLQPQVSGGLPSRPTSEPAPKQEPSSSAAQPPREKSEMKGRGECAPDDAAKLTEPITPSPALTSTHTCGAVWMQLGEWRKSRYLAVAVVTVAIVLDMILTTAILPMLPDFFKRSQDSDAALNEDVVSHNSSSPPRVTSYLQQRTTEFVYSSGEQNTTHGSSSNLATKIGVLIASKTLFEMICNPLCGIIADRFGCTIIMFTGFFVTFSSTLIFAFAERYDVLLVARSIQGVGSAAMFAPGFGLIADKFPDDEERAKAISISYGGSIFGLIIGPTFGGIMYQWYGKTVPFLVLAGITLVDGCLRAFIAEPKRTQREKGPTVKELLTDPYIVIILGGLFFLSYAHTTIEPLLPVWMMETMNANSAQRGLAFLPVFLTLFLALNILNRLNVWMERFWMAMLGFFILGVCLILLPLAKNQVQLILPTAFIGLGTGLVECALLPHLAYMVDLRHKSVYGTVYALSQSSYCLAAMIGAPLSGIVASYIGIEWTFFGVAVTCIIYAPMLYCIRNPSRGRTVIVKESFEQEALALYHERPDEGTVTLREVRDEIQR